MPEKTGFFVDTSADGLYMSRFDKDYLLYGQSRAGYVVSRAALFERQSNRRREEPNLGNFAETGPGVRVSSALLEKSKWITANWLHAIYLIGNHSTFPMSVWECGMCSRAASILFFLASPAHSSIWSPPTWMTASAQGCAMPSAPTPPVCCPCSVRTTSHF
jgi:hypothetical protein